MKQHIGLAFEICDKENVSYGQVKWEYLKFEIRNRGKIQRTQKKKIAVLDSNDNQEYMKCNLKIENIKLS